ncbi:MAG: TIGR01777 family oxidoreductase [Acidobacteriota bacterium]
MVEGHNVNARGRVLISGGSGMIGRALTAMLAEGDWEVVVLSRSPEKVAGLPAGARAVGWDGRTAEGWGELVDGAAGIVNLAGRNIAGGRWTAAEKERLRSSRLEPSRAIVEAIRAAATKPSFLMQASAVGFYGGDTGDALITEESPPGDDFLAELSVEWEASTEPVEALGVRRVLLRTGIVLSLEGGALPKMAMPFRFGVGGSLGDGEQYMPWIHLNDEAEAIRFLMEHPEAAGPFNLSAPKPVTNDELSRVLARVLHRPNLLRVPAFALKLAMGEMSRLLLGGQRAVPRALEDLDFPFRFSDLESALENLLAD